MIAMNTCCGPEAGVARIPFLKAPLATFAASLGECLDPDELGMKTWTSFAAVLEKSNDVRGEVHRNKLPEGKIRRSEIFALAADPNVSIATVCVAALAWGGMRYGHFTKLCKTNSGEWLHEAERIRKEKLTRVAAYASLMKLRKEEKLKGMGPAFFTKLIYFLTPRDEPERQPAYIMDQWASSSMNLLTGSTKVVLDVNPPPKFPPEPSKSTMAELALSYSFSVSDKNTAAHYEAFCSAIDQLACRFCLGTDQVDQALFGADAIGPGSWRRYVVLHRLLSLAFPHSIPTAIQRPVS